VGEKVVSGHARGRATEAGSHRRLRPHPSTLRSPWKPLGCAALLVAAAAQAHIVYGTRTLLGLVAESELVMRARILETGTPVGLSTERGGASRPTVEADVLEVLKGSYEGARVRFAQHGHGVAPFAPGEETLLFLTRIEGHRELDVLGRAGALDWVSLQEHEDVYLVRSGTGAVLLAAVRDYVAAEAAAPEERDAIVARATVGLLASRDAQLAASALRDLVLAAERPLVTRDDLPVLLALLDDPELSMGVRVALITELERRGLADGDPHWLRWLSAGTPKRDRITAIRAAGVSGSARVRERLVGLLTEPDADVVAAAAAALGSARDAEAVAPLARAVSHESAKVRSAAIRGLGRIAAPSAEAALTAVADAHPDPGTRRRARAELDKRTGGVSR